MDETQKMLEAKTSAVTALSEALQRGIREERITNLQDVGHFLDAWTGAMVEMVGSRPETAATPAWQTGPEPKIGTQLIDKDDDRWMRMANGAWFMVASGQRMPDRVDSVEGTYSWEYVLNQYGPLRPYVA